MGISNSISIDPSTCNISSLTILPAPPPPQGRDKREKDGSKKSTLTKQSKKGRKEKKKPRYATIIITTCHDFSNSSSSFLTTHRTHTNSSKQLRLPGLNLLVRTHPTHDKLAYIHAHPHIHEWTLPAKPTASRNAGSSHSLPWLHSVVLEDKVFLPCRVRVCALLDHAGPDKYGSWHSRDLD